MTPGLTAPARGWTIGINLTNSLGRSSRVQYVLYDNTVFRIVQNGSSRNWSDGTYAATCAAYRNPTGRYGYAGMTGDGRYTIDPDGSGPVPPVAVRCTDMDSRDITPGTAIDALYTGVHGFPGHSTSSNVKWVDPGSQAAYLAIAKLTSTHTITATVTSELRWDVIYFYSSDNRQITYCSGSCEGFTFRHNGDSAFAFWQSYYVTDGNTDGGHGLYVRSPTVTFR